MADRLTEEERAEVYEWATETRKHFNSLPAYPPMRELPREKAARFLFELRDEATRLREAGNHDVADLIAARDAAFEQRDALEERIREALDALPVHEKTDRYHSPRCGTCWERWPCDIGAARMALSPTHYAKTEGVTP